MGASYRARLKALAAYNANQSPKILSGKLGWNPTLAQKARKDRAAG